MAVLYCFANKEVWTPLWLLLPGTGLVALSYSPPLAFHGPWGGDTARENPPLSPPTTTGEVGDEEEVAALETRPPSALLRPVMR